MFAVERLGSYITRGVYTVSGPFHPFGGAVDIIVVEQPDGSFKSSPWNVRFGKFQGVLRAREKVVNISVNGVDANFHMYLDERGAAYFLREVEDEEGESLQSSPSSSKEMDGKFQEQRRSRKSKSHSYDGSDLSPSVQIDDSNGNVMASTIPLCTDGGNGNVMAGTNLQHTGGSNGKVMAETNLQHTGGSNGKVMSRSNSQRSRILGLVFGRRSVKESSHREGDDGAGMVRRSSLDRAEMAADLLEVKWSTNLATAGPKKHNAPQLSASDKFVAEGVKPGSANDEENQVSSSLHTTEPSVSQCTSAEENSSSKVIIGNHFQSVSESPELAVSEACVDMSGFDNLEKVVETSRVEKIVSEDKCGLVSQIVSEGKIVAKCTNIEELILKNDDIDADAEGVVLVHEVTTVSKIPDMLKACPGESLDEDPVAADLSEVKCSTNLATAVPKRYNASQLSASDEFVGEGIKPGSANDEEKQVSSSLHDTTETSVNQCTSAVEKSSSMVNIGNHSQSVAESPELAVSEACVDMSGFDNLEKVVETSRVEKIVLEYKCGSVSAKCTNIEELTLKNADIDGDAESFVHEVTTSVSQIPDVLKACPGESLDEDPVAADLSELKCSTNLATAVSKTDDASQLSASDKFVTEEVKPGSAHDEENQMSSSLRDITETSVSRCMSANSSSKVNIGGHSQSVSESPEHAVSEACVDMSGFDNLEKDVETSQIEQILLEDKHGLVSAKCTNIEELTFKNADIKGDGEGVVHEVTTSVSQIPDVVKACPGESLDEDPVSDESNASLPVFSIAEEESGFGEVQSVMHLETSVTGINDSSEQAYRLELASGHREVSPCTKKLHATNELQPEDFVNQSTKDMERETKCIQAYDNCCQQINMSSCTNGHDELNLDVPDVVSVHSDEVVDSKSISTSSSSCNSIHQIQVAESVGLGITSKELKASFSCVCDSEQVVYDSTKPSCIPLSESSEEDQFLFGDLDEFKLNDTEDKSNFPVAVDKGDHPLCHSEGIEEVNGSFNDVNESHSSPEMVEEGNQLPDVIDLMENSQVMSSSINVPTGHRDAGVELGRLAQSLPSTWPHLDMSDIDGFTQSLSHSVGRECSPLELTLHREVESYCANLESENQPVQEHSSKEATQNSNLKSDVATSATGDPSKAQTNSSGSWRLWPFNFRKSRSSEAMQIDQSDTLQPPPNDTTVKASPNDAILQLPLDDTTLQQPLIDRTVQQTLNDIAMQLPLNDLSMQSTLNNPRNSDAESPSGRNIDTKRNRNVLERKIRKHLIRAVSPTSEQLASLNLKEGRNVVTFTFSTAMLGKQQVDARIFLWKWNTRIVISDVDGTITKSDVLGQFMPLVGVDWSQTGVAHLFSAIKENGYQLLFLSARAISQAYITRQFLINLKQDGKALPEGPVVISPDGLFPSLFREVIRRAPHEFKIACLEEIRALFPADCNPFYAGFGNRDTDEISYMKVGIPKGKIFIINPKGEVAVNRRVDTRSYTSLHTLVHGMFPSRASFEQEDFNSWNFWRLPPPSIEN